MSPQQAAASWMRNLEPYAKQGVRLGAPAPAYDQARARSLRHRAI
jgi:hypothetical protein